MTSIATRLRDIIEPWSEQMLNHPLAELARSGNLPSSAMAAYLESLRVLFGSAEHNLQTALERATQLRNPALAAYFERKLREEVGHDRWAADDLRQLPGVAKRQLSAVPSAVRLVELQRTLISEHPLCYVAYILWTEYFSVLVGDSWLDALETSGYARSQVSAIAKHIEADREHSAAVLREIDVLWQGDPPLDSMLSAVERACRVFESFCCEVHGVAQRAA